METIDYMIMSLNNPLLTGIAGGMDSPWVFAALLAAIVLLTEKRNEKRKKIFIAIIAAVVFAFAVKEIYAAPRPCEAFASKVPCPGGYSFPSIHAAAAFALMLSFMNKPSYWLYLLFALFVSFSRIYLGLHTFTDVAGAIVIASLAYYATDRIMVKRNDNR